jgi:RNA polymerase sigma factor (sigma-70 family)
LGTLRIGNFIHAGVFDPAIDASVQRRSPMELTLRARPRPSRSEGALVEAARRGDDRAFEELYARYRERIHAFILSKVRDHGRAEDLGQEVFMSALRQLRASDSPIMFKPWLFTIAKNACIDEFRRGSRAREVPIESDEELAAGGGAAADRFLAAVPTPESAIQSKQRLDDLRGAFGGLSDSQHRLLVMREFEGLSYDEIGARLGMTRQMVESGLFRARRKLGEEYAELASGRRCEEIQSAIDAGRLAVARSLGIKQRRRYARHLSHCQPCRHVAMMSAVDEALLTPRTLVEKIAALLPVPLLTRLWPRHRGGRAAAHAAAHHSAATGAGAGAAGATGGAAAGTGAGVGLGQATAVLVAAAAGVGGSFAIVHGTHGHHAAPSPRVVRHGSASATAAASARLGASRHRDGLGGRQATRSISGPGHRHAPGAGHHRIGGSPARHHRATVSSARSTATTPARPTPAVPPSHRVGGPVTHPPVRDPTTTATVATTTTSPTARRTTTTRPGTTVGVGVPSVPGAPTVTQTVAVTVPTAPVQTVTQVVQTIVTGATQGVSTALSGVTSGVSTAVSGVTSGVSTALGGLTTTDPLGGVGPGVKTAVGGAGQGVQTAVGGVGSGVQTTLGGVGQGVGGLLGGGGGG